MINTSEYLLYLQEQQALVCRSCKYCLQPNGVERYLQRNHLAISLKILSSIVAENPMECKKYVSLIGQLIAPRKNFPRILTCVTTECNVYNVIKNFKFPIRRENSLRKNQSTHAGINQKKERFLRLKWSTRLHIFYTYKNNKHWSVEVVNIVYNPMELKNI
jgi:hypothetical protein